MLRLGLTVRSSVDADGHVRYCYLAKDGSEAPNIRVKPGDWLILSLKNEIEIPPATAANSMKMGTPGKPTPDGCTKTGMTPLSTNLHFHGLTVPPVCHQDDVLKTVVQARRCRRLNIASRFLPKKLRGCTGITLMFMDLQAPKCLGALPAR